MLSFTRNHKHFALSLRGKKKPFHTNCVRLYLHAEEANILCE